MNVPLFPIISSFVKFSRLNNSKNNWCGNRELCGQKFLKSWLQSWIEICTFRQEGKWKLWDRFLFSLLKNSISVASLGENITLFFMCQTSLERKTIRTVMYITVCPSFIKTIEQIWKKWLAIYIYNLLAFCFL